MNDLQRAILIAMLDDMNNRILALQEISEMTTELITLMSARLLLLEKAREPVVQSDKKETIQ